MLTDQQRENIIHKLLSTWHYYEIRTSPHWSRSVRSACKRIGFVKPSKFAFYIKAPDSEIISRANKVYEDTLYHLRFNDFYTQDTIKDFMTRHVVLCEETRQAELNDDLDPVYFWTEDMSQKKEAYSKAIEEIKIKLYKNSDATDKQIEDIRADLRKSQKLYNELYSREHQFDYLTVEEIASKHYTRFLYDNTLYTTDKKQVKGLPPFFLDSVANIVRSESITGTQLREIAHTSPWLQIYKTAQPNPFADVPLSNDILQLMSLTRWYEWVRDMQSDQRPSDKVIDDDDMLDGWYILWERERPKRQDLLIESSKFNVENFVMCRTPEEADAVYLRNQKASKILMEQRAMQIFSSDKGVKNQDLGDNKFDIGIAANVAGFAAAKAKVAGKR